MEEVIFLRQAALVAKLPSLEYLCYTRMVRRVWTSLIFPDPSAFFYSNGTVNKLLVYKDNKTFVLSWVFGNFNQCCLPSGTKHFHSNDIVFRGKKKRKEKKSSFSMFCYSVLENSTFTCWHQHIKDVLWAWVSMRNLYFQFLSAGPSYFLSDPCRILCCH